MPPPMTTPRRTRGSRSRKSISAAGLGENKLLQTCARSKRTGPIKVQPTTESARRASSTPFTQSIVLRSRTFTCALTARGAPGVRETFRMYQAGDFSQSLADAGARAENFIGLIGIDAPVSHCGNGFQISPVFCRCRALRSHTGFDNNLWRFGYHILVG